LLSLGAYETLERYAVAKYIPSSLPVVELGAALGVVSCLVNRRLGDRRRQVSVEPNPALLPVLESNRRRNGCQFQIVQGALAYDCATVAFHASESIVDSAVARHGASDTVAVRALSLRDIMTEAGFDRCVLLCDVEGMEQALVRRESRLLRERIAALVIEVHPEILGHSGISELRAGLEDAGFELLWDAGNVWAMTNPALTLATAQETVSP
jgi:FkbM family methyltransferase